MSAVCFKKLHNRVVQKKASILSKKSDTERGNIEASVMWSSCGKPTTGHRLHAQGCERFIQTSPYTTDWPQMISTSRLLSFSTASPHIQHTHHTNLYHLKAAHSQYVPEYEVKVKSSLGRLWSTESKFGKTKQRLWARVWNEKYQSRFNKAWLRLLLLREANCCLSSGLRFHFIIRKKHTFCYNNTAKRQDRDCSLCDDKRIK